MQRLPMETSRRLPVFLLTILILGTVSHGIGQEAARPPAVTIGLSMNRLFSADEVFSTILIDDRTSVGAMPPSAFLRVRLLAGVVAELSYGEHRTIKSLEGYNWYGILWYRTKAVIAVAKYRWRALAILYHFPPYRMCQPYIGYRYGELHNRDYPDTYTSTHTDGVARSLLLGLTRPVNSYLHLGLELDWQSQKLHSQPHCFTECYDVPLYDWSDKRSSLDLNLYLQIEL